MTLYRIMTTFDSARRQTERGKGTNMKKKFDIRSMVLGALLGMAIIFSVAAAADERAVWEYKLVAGTVFGSDSKGQLDDAINTAANQGWQFVSASHSMERYGFAIMRRDKR